MIYKPHMKWRPEHEEWLKAHYYEYETIKSLTNAFNSQFGTMASIEAVQQRSCHLGLHSNKFKTPHNYTEEQKDFIRENYGKYNRRVVYEMFCEHFGITDVSFMGFRAYISNSMKLRLEEKNKFCTAGFEQKRLPIGAIRKQGGMWFIKVDDKIGKRGSHDAERHNWQEYCRYVWEQHYGKIPEGYSIVFLDGNRDNCVIDNLDCVDKRTFCFMQTNHLFCEDARLTKTSILAAKVMREVIAPQK